jgi:hypothetical protein
VRPIGIESEPVAPGESVAILRLIPDGIVPASAEAFVDPPTAAAFRIERIDELDAGETFAETGHLSRSVRLVVRNTSAAPASFRMTIPVIPDPHALERELGKLAEDAWRTAWDRVRRAGGT